MADKFEGAVFSIKPKYAKYIFSGAKTVELRRTNPRQLSEGSIIYIYVSSPSKRLAGKVRVVSVLRLPLAKLWNKIKNFACVSLKEFTDYYEGAEEGVAVFINNIEEFNEQPHLNDLRTNIDFRPPQSFKYVTAKEEKYFRRQIVSNIVLDSM